VENLELEEQRVWKHKLKSKHLMFFLILIFCFSFGFGGHHCQLLREVSSLFFLFVLLIMGMGGLITKSWHKVKLLVFFSFSFCFVFLGVGGLHHQLSIEREPFFFLFVLLFMGAGGCHLPSSSRGGACYVFFCFFFY
jgi:membrane-associated HD superfamily phosphohydrolase